MTTMELGMMRVRGATAAMVLLAGLSACENGTGPDSGPPASLNVVSGDLQTATVGTELAQPLVVRVLDSRGRPVRGVVVNFRVTAGNGQVFAGAANTNNDGEARERWTLGTVAGDTQRVEVRAVDASTGQAQVFGVFRAVGTPDAPAEIAAVGTAQRSGVTGQAVAPPLAVKVSDRHGNGVPGVPVTWTTAGAASGTVSPAASTTGADGVVQAAWTLGLEVRVQQHAQAAGAGGTVQFSAQATPSWSLLTRVAGHGQAGIAGAALADSLAVKVVDAAGAPVAGVLVEWRPQAGPGRVDGSASPASSVSGPDGIARTRWTLGPTVGMQRISAESPYGPNSGIGVDFYATAVAPAAPGASTDSVRGGGSTAVGWATVRPEGKAGTSWFERGSQPDLSDAQVVGSQAFAAGSDPIHRSLTLAPAPGETVYFRVAASNAYGTARGRILSFRGISTQTSFRARFDQAAMSVVLEWDDVGDWAAKFYARDAHGNWYDIHQREAAAPEEWTYGDRRETEDLMFDVTKTSAGPYYMLRCPRPMNDKSGCTRFDAPAVAVVPLAPPTGLQAAPVANGVHLTWQDNATNEVDYVIERRSLDGSFQARFLLDQNASSYTDASAPASGSFRYQVYARVRYRSVWGVPSDWALRVSAPAEATVTRP